MFPYYRNTFPIMRFSLVYIPLNGYENIRREILFPDSARTRRCGARRLSRDAYSFFSGLLRGKFYITWFPFRHFCDSNVSSRNAESL